MSSYEEKLEQLKKNFDEDIEFIVDKLYTKSLKDKTQFKSQLSFLLSLRSLYLKNCEQFERFMMPVQYLEEKEDIGDKNIIYDSFKVPEELIEYAYERLMERGDIIMEML